MSVVTGRASLLVKMAARRLLRVEPQLRVGFFGSIVAATDEEGE